MSIVKSFSVGNGDMFFVDHNSDNFTLIDCCLDESTQTAILTEVATRSSKKGIHRFISTHPDEDHLRGLTELDAKLSIMNFYCVANQATKEDETDDFLKYKDLRDSSKAFNIYAGCQRRWMNLEDAARKSSGITIHWPDMSNTAFQDALALANAGESPNNISPVVGYACGAAGFIWMGDLETDFMEDIAESIKLPKATVLFAPHHGRDSGRVPAALMEQMDPTVVVIGEAPSEHLNYYSGYNTITQNSAGSIVFDVGHDYVDVYVGSQDYEVGFLANRHLVDCEHGTYLGSIKLVSR